MATKTKKSMIGAFVLGAVALGVGAVIVFGSGMFFTTKYAFIMFFENSVSGLQVGAPVLFRGVPIGMVTDISIDANTESLHFYIPVKVEIESGKVRVTVDRKAQKEQTLLEARKEPPEAFLGKLIERGLRAQLVTQSFVTGQLAVALDIMPDTQARLVGDSPLPEIPTVPSTFEKLTQTLTRLPLETLVDRLTAAVEGIDRLINSPQIQALPAKMDTTLAVGTDLLRDIQGKIGPLAANLDEAVKSYAELAKGLDTRTAGLSTAAGKTLANLDATLKEGSAALGSIQKLTRSDSPTVTDLQGTLREISAAARSLRALADYLERHPEALIQGKGNRR
ncbi:MlaD family protein [Desulfolutivibrio sulfoxidireducens]|uniref:MlaD family protein n=1 Tax=Desulfolutivibrio sulfoxidireducens TaxID=2773299 RepID=UPI00159E8D47|nr:MlaD family protein [Desulfolutivibrio sulfoxidireducens]QLA15996.1 MCE family protein [Desulfolutivibrio sulfoxidireducens]